jgi:23S rRNA (guanine2445-N2)-methyltransferase / 23S rRNA (guanine2069-N7)-methyltransferase
MSDATVCFATCPKGSESLLADELKAMGAAGVRQVRAGASFTGDLETAYRACLWSRVASRVLLRLARFPMEDADGLYAAVRDIPWEDHVSPDGTIAVDFVGLAPGIRDTRFGAVRVKDAVVDRLRERFGRRPDVDTTAPDLRINVSVHGGEATVALDLSGDSLHRRGWREPGVQVAAPLKENLAAAVLLAAGWQEAARDGWAFSDPMCGSGTLVIEAAGIASDRAPGLLRQRWGFSNWLGHDEEVWARLLEEADDRAEEGAREVPTIEGSDIDERSLRIAEDDARRAGVGSMVRFERRDMTVAGGREAAGLVAVNPPYGVRLSPGEDLRALYRTLGETLRHGYPGWAVAVLATDRTLARELRLPNQREYVLYNGPIECELLLAEMPGPPVTGPRHVAERLASATTLAGETDATSGAAAFANRLRKNARHFGKWARRSGVECYRVYDADLPEYAVAIDRYRDSAVIAEYEAPSEIDPVLAARRLAEVAALCPEVLSLDAANVHVKVRRRQRGEAQYERLGEDGRFIEVEEGGLRFLVNLTDYLDTGLFLDHRVTRAMIRDMAAGKRFANLFAYTGTASVYAADGGATSTTSVDLSATYLDWALRNLEVNGLRSPANTIVRADATRWIESVRPRSFDLVFCDPPTFSNSTRMDDTFDVARDHMRLLRNVRRVLADDGVVVFSTNARRFRLDSAELDNIFDIEDVSKATIPPDFARSPRIHQCWLLRAR